MNKLYKSFRATVTAVALTIGVALFIGAALHQPAALAADTNPLGGAAPSTLFNTADLVNDCLTNGQKSTLLTNYYYCKGKELGLQVHAERTNLTATVYKSLDGKNWAPFVPATYTIVSSAAMANGVDWCTNVSVNAYCWFKFVFTTDALVNEPGLSNAFFKAFDK